MIHKVLNFMIRLKQGAPLGLSWYTKYASWSPNLRYRTRIVTYILIYLPIYSCLLVEYSTEKCLYLGVSKYEKGVRYVYSKSKGRGHYNFFLGNPPVFSFATVRKHPESAPVDMKILMALHYRCISCGQIFKGQRMSVIKRYM